MATRLPAPGLAESGAQGGKLVPSGRREVRARAPGVVTAAIYTSGNGNFAASLKYMY